MISIPTTLKLHRIVFKNACFLTATGITKLSCNNPFGLMLLLTACMCLHDNYAYLFSSFPWCRIVI